MMHKTGHWTGEADAFYKLGKSRTSSKGLKSSAEGQKKIRIADELCNITVEKNHRAGGITCIELQNFMNHSNFVFNNINPNVNIITGQNGAGKSSIAQAVVLGLGGSTRSIKRHSSIAQFVKHDTNKAEISITMCNVGDDSYHHEKYGDSIIFNRTISRTGSSMFYLKNDDQHIVYSGKIAYQEAEKIHEHFNINLGNPLTVLQQEEAKQFFMRDDLKTSLYEFVMQSTLLKTIQDDYRDSKTELDLASHQILEKQRHLEEHEQTLSEISEKCRLYHKFCSNDRLGDNKTKEMVKWGFANQCKDKYETMKRKYDKLSKDKEELEFSKRNCCEKMEEFENKLKDKEFDNANVKDSVLRFEDELTKCRKNVKEFEFRLNDLKAEQKENALIKEDLKNRIQEISNKINLSKKSRFQTQIEETEFNKRKEDLDKHLQKLHIDKVQKEDRIKSIGIERAKLHDKLKLVDEKIAAMERSINTFADEMKETQASIDKMTSANMNRFGIVMQKLLEKIEENRKIFIKPPLGPVGKYITLKGEAAQTSRLGDLLEVELGIHLLKAFLCHCTEDRRKLENLMRPLFYGTNMKMPIIYTRKFSWQQYPQVKVRTDYPSVLNYLDIDNPDIFNLLVDEKNIDRVLILTVPKIEAMFMKWFTVPKNTLYAITLDFYRYYPQRQETQNYSSYHMNYNPSNRKRFPNLLAAANNDEVYQMKKNIQDIDCDIKRLQDTRKPLTEEKNNLKDALSLLAKEDKDTREDVSEMISKEAQYKMELNQDIEEHDKLRDLEGPLQRLKTKYQKALTDKKEIDKSIHEMQNKKNDNFNKAAWAKDQIESVLEGCQDDVIANLKRQRDGYSRKFDQLQKDSIEKTQTLEACRLDMEEYYNSYKEAEREAYKFSNGKKPDMNLKGKEVEAMIEEARRKKAEFVATMKGQSIDAITKMMHTKERQVRILKEGISDMIVKLKTLEEMVDRRRRLTINLRSAMFRQVSRNFTSEMENCNLDAKLSIQYKHKSIEIFAKPRSGINEGPTADARDLTSLSGGERSKTLLCFIKGLWTFQYSPFRFMDEWNVYVDDYSRPALENMLVMHSLKNNFQCFLISPRCSDVSDYDEENQDCITFVKVGKK